MLANTLSGRKKVKKEKKEKKPNSTTPIKFGSPLQKRWLFKPFMQMTASKKQSFEGTL